MRHRLLIVALAITAMLVVRPAQAEECVCSDGSTPPGSAADLTACCTLCRDSHGGASQAGASFAGATEACPSLGPGALGGTKEAAPPAPSIPRLVNPLGAGITPAALIGRVIKGALGISGTIALAIFVWGGFVWLTSGGSPEKIDTAKRLIVWAVLGLALIFGAYAVTSFVINAITGATLGGGGGGRGGGAACPGGQIVCAGSCTDVTRDPRNCGSCGNVCGTLEVCEASRCVEIGAP